MEAYKVVSRDRECVNFAVYRNKHGDAAVDLMLKAFPKLHAYHKFYYPNTIVHAASNAKSLMCFRSREDAIDFMDYYVLDFIIIAVKGLSEPMPITLVRASGFGLYELARTRHQTLTIKAPVGTIGFRSIEVLE
jgi:hypothetical protein